MLETRTEETRADISRPENDHTGPPVDLRMSLGTQSYAIEHTQIEAFAGQIQMEEEFGQLIRPVIDELSGTLPKPGVYYLLFPTRARIRANANQLKIVQNDLMEWIREHAQQLYERSPDRPTREKNPRGSHEKHQERPPGFPYEVILSRETHWTRSSRHDGVLLPSRYAPEQVEDLRVDRLRNALDRKCPKLQLCKEEGARTVLVLEDADICLSNHVLIGDGLAGPLEERPNLPDEIYLVETAIDRWGVRVLKYDDNCLPEEGWTEFNSAELIDITNEAAEHEQ